MTTPWRAGRSCSHSCAGPSRHTRCSVATGSVRRYKGLIMSRAFVKESDDDLTAGELPERPLPPHVNYVTPKGLELLQARERELAERHEELKRQADDDSEARQKVREIDRDLRYFRSQ